MARQIGYGRAWRNAAALTRQHSQLQAIGCAALYGDEAKGSATFRPGLDAAIGALSAGDCLAVVSLARLAWREDELRQIILAVQARHAHLRSLSEDFDTRSPSSVFQTIRALQAFADAVRQDREGEALGGADPRTIPVAAEALARAIASVEDGSTTAEQASAALGISRATFYRRWSQAAA